MVVDVCGDVWNTTACGGAIRYTRVNIYNVDRQGAAQGGPPGGEWTTRGRLEMTSRSSL